MKVRIQTWSRRPGTLSIYRGPLAYSLQIDEEYRRMGKPNGWDAIEIHPRSAWNFGLAPNPDLKVVSSPMPKSGQVWEAKRVPVRMIARARRIPEWTLDHYGLVAPLQKAPARSMEPEETVTLIPMGAARLRISVFPTATPSGTPWRPTQSRRVALPATFSHIGASDSADALSDGLVPASSHDEEIPRFTWWDHKGTEEWVQYTYPAPRAFQSCRVYWFDDAPSKGFCRLPASWKLLARVDGKWTEVDAKEGFPLRKDGWCEISFATVVAAELRLVAQLREGFSAGILEWEFQ